MRYPVLPVDWLDDGFIECGDYPDWPSACTEIKRRRYDRKLLDELLVSLPLEGFQEPLVIGAYSRSARGLFLSDGHHRAVAAFELGIREFPYRWRWYPQPVNRFEPGPLPADRLKTLGGAPWPTG